MRKSIVLFDFYDWEITLREVVFSVLIIGIMGFLGFLIAQEIEKREYDSTLKYRQAPALETNDDFQHAMRTDFGDVFAHGLFQAKDTVRYEHIDGEYLYIHIAKQEYRMHTQHYTTRDSKGHVHHHTRHYWSWDTISTDTMHSKRVVFCGVTFPYDKFGYGHIPENSKIYKAHGWSNRREVIKTMPTEFSATIFANVKNNTISEKTTLMTIGIEDYRMDLTATFGSVVFWVMWVVLTIILLVGFYHIDNEWLEG